MEHNFHWYMLLAFRFIILDTVNVGVIGNDVHMQRLNIVSAADYYTAGVVEFSPQVFGNSEDIVKEHVDAYMQILKSIEANETDIVVFPESTLNTILKPTVVPDPALNINLCLDNISDNYELHLKKISCTARDTQKYVVVNLKEREICKSNGESSTTCASHGWNLYNTNVVFNREGRIVSRYRKWHVYVEPNINKTQEPEYAIFETDFGVRFGHFICFDLLFYTPPQELVTNYGVRDLIFTSNFVSELPFLTATQLQMSWAWGNNVNVLAAGASQPRRGATGSGIYAGNKGALVRTMVGEDDVRKILVARLPKKADFPVSVSMTPKMPQHRIFLLQDPQITNFSSELLNFTMQYTNREICTLDLCCNFNITTLPYNLNINTIGNYYRYRLGAFKGTRSYQKEEYSDVSICALYACTNESVESCGTIFQSNILPPLINFTQIIITGNFTKYKRMLLMPNTLDTSLYSLNTNDVAWSIEEQESEFMARIELLTPQADLLTFGIYANNYDSFNKSGSKDIKYSLLKIMLIVLTVTKLRIL